jgi:lambda repressor-like predicted transcriptional regulator
MEKNLTAAIAATNHNILLGILKKGSSRNATARMAGIAPTTFYRNLERPETFTLRDLGQIAEVLDLTLEDIFRSAA